MSKKNDDTKLARWLANELSAAELAEFEKTSEFKEYQAIASASARFLKPEFDKEQLFDKIKASKRKTKPSKVIRLRPMIYLSGIACSILLILSVLFYNKTYSTGIGEQLAVTLPDGSKVELNANSSLTHRRFFWKNNRSLTLKGEAFFDVEKGQTFQVASKMGTVAVLGTEFNIRTRGNHFDLQCYEGKVQFKDVNNNTEILIAGDEMILVDDKIDRKRTVISKPIWMQGLSSFSNQPLALILEELQAQYGIAIKNNNVDLDQRFTGSFVHNNIDTALKTILLPMDIIYSFEDNTLEISSPK